MISIVLVIIEIRCRKLVDLLTNGQVRDVFLCLICFLSLRGRMGKQRIMGFPKISGFWCDRYLE